MRLKKRKHEKRLNYRLLDNLPFDKRNSTNWLSVDEVIESLSISRRQFWNLVHEDRFPTPYLYRKSMIYHGDDLDNFIKKCTEFNESDCSPIKIEKRSYIVTWSKMKRYLKSKSRALPCTYIANELKADRNDIYSILKLMTIAGEVISYYPLDTKTKFYEIAKK